MHCLSAWPLFAAHQMTWAIWVCPSAAWSELMMIPPSCWRWLREKRMQSECVSKNERNPQKSTKSDVKWLYNLNKKQLALHFKHSLGRWELGGPPHSTRAIMAQRWRSNVPIPKSRNHQKRRTSEFKRRKVPNDVVVGDCWLLETGKLAKYKLIEKTLDLNCSPQIPLSDPI